MSTIFINEISVYPDYVIVFGARVERPSAVARSDWIREWSALEAGGKKS